MSKVILEKAERVDLEVAAAPPVEGEGSTVEVSRYAIQPMCFLIESDAPGNSHYLKRIG
jgi:hypothetical protein